MIMNMHLACRPLWGTCPLGHSLLMDWSVHTPLCEWVSFTRWVKSLLDEMPDEPTVFEKEFSFDEMEFEDEPYTVTYDEKNKVYNVEGPRIEKMLGYTNLDSEKGFAFFQKFLKETGILDELEAKGIQEGDTVKMYGLQFDYYK